MTVPSVRGRGIAWRFVVLLVCTAAVVVPIVATVMLALRPYAARGGEGVITLDNFVFVFRSTRILDWLVNSLVVTLAAMVVSILVAAPAGYVISRAKGKLIPAYSLVLFVVQALPVIVSIIPLFMLFAALGLVDTLVGVGVIYVGATVTVATWTMAAYFDSIPISLEEAAWIDGCSIFSAFWRIVLRNSFPGILSTAIFAFLLAWNDYLVGLVFLKSTEAMTLPIGLQSFFQQNVTDWGAVMAVAVVTMAPPTLVFAFLNRYFSIGGIGGALAGN